MSLTDYEMLQNEVADQQQEIAEQKSLAAYAEQRANIAEKANDALVLKNASLSSQVTRGVDDCNKLVIENNELKAIVGCHRKALAQISELDSVNQDECSWMAQQALSALPRTYLQSVKADAVKDAIFNSEQIELFEDSHHIGKYVCLEDLEVNIKQLREGKS